MRKFLIIARREYLERVKTRSFIIITILLPVIMIGATVILPRLLARGAVEAKHYVIVGTSRAAAEMLREGLKRAVSGESGEAVAGQAKEKGAPKLNLTAEISTDTTEGARNALIEKVKKKELDGVIFGTDDRLAAGKIGFYTRDTASLTTQQLVKEGLTDGVRRAQLVNKGLTGEEVDKVLRPVEMEVQGPGGTGNPVAVYITVLSLVMIMYLAVTVYGAAVQRAILEEKTSRVMEVMLAAARPIEMLSGKIFGVGAVGLTQMGIWVGTGMVFGAFGVLSSGMDVKGIFSVKAMLFMGLFFLLGYAMNSTLSAAIGAMATSDQETQQLQVISMVPMVIAVTVMGFVMQFPNGTLSFWMSMFPLTAPLIMFARIAIQQPPLWQIVLSIALILGTTVGFVFLCARIYRVGILMYGKRVTLPEIMKWIRYA
jgi:ABC-2 type transport system permease protein